MTEKLALQDSIRLMAGCVVLVTNDSSLMHVANALDVPTGGLYGAADILETGRREKRFINLNADGYCSPCVQNRCLNKTEPLICLKTIRPETVAAAVKGAFSQTEDPLQKIVGEIEALSQSNLERIK